MPKRLEKKFRLKSFYDAEQQQDLGWLVGRVVDLWTTLEGRNRNRIGFGLGRNTISLCVLHQKKKNTSGMCVTRQRRRTLLTFFCCIAHRQNNKQEPAESWEQEERDEGQ